MKREKRYWDKDKKEYRGKTVEQSINKVALLPISPEVAFRQMDGFIDILSERGERVARIDKKDWAKFTKNVNFFNDGLNEEEK